MKGNTPRAALALAGLYGLGLCARPARAAVTYSYTQIDPFGSALAGASGISASGQVAGGYYGAGGPLGFVTGPNGGGTPTTIDPFGFASEYVTGLNASGQVVGDYVDATRGRQYGFLATPQAAPAVPEVSPLALLALGLLPAARAARRRRA